ncbi:MAG TPA: LysR family transcriptional regulator [Syntrophorhabdus aromaticivorans]|nr:LysR family transcriptional regulator [Syntrophorhabdus aromaticivorans]
MRPMGTDTFLAIIENGSLSRAAEQLKITQSTVSLRLKNLEEELGCTLIDRRRGERTIELTPAGKIYLRFAEQIRDISQDMNADEHSGGSLKIGGVDSANVFLLPPVVRSLTTHTPSVKVILGTHQSWQIQDLIERRQLDAGFAITVQRSPNIVVQPLIREEYFLMRLHRKGERSDSVIDAKTLDSLEELHINWGSDYMLWHDQIWNPLETRYIQLDTIACITRMLFSPKQWAIVTASVKEFFGEEYLFQRLDPPPPPRPMYFLTHRHPRLSAVKGLRILGEIITDFFPEED